MTVQRTWSHETEFAPEASSVCEARAFVLVHLLDHHLVHLVDDVELVVSELATNVTRHAQTPFTVILGAVDETVLLEVLDGSPEAPVLAVAGALDAGGRGIAIVQALCLDWGYAILPSGGKSVWAQFDVKSASS